MANQAFNKTWWPQPDDEFPKRASDLRHDESDAQWKSSSDAPVVQMARATPNRTSVECGVGTAPSFELCDKGQQWKYRAVYCNSKDCQWSIKPGSTVATCVPKTMTFSPFRVQTQAETNYLYDLLVAVTDALEAANITYVIAGGTLIGALRNRPPGMMRWDDDLDIVVPEYDYARTAEALFTDGRFHFRTYSDKTHNDQFYKVGLAGRGGGDNMDIFQVAYREKKIGQGGDKAWRLVLVNSTILFEMYNMDYFTQEELFPTRPCAFYDLVVQCPANGVAPLQRTYGNDIFSKFVTQAHHGKNEVNHSDGLLTNLNDPLAYTPAMTTELMHKLISNPNVVV
eukprot:scaffold5092_cov179-Amphora_coffeaeformis.AAC.8